MFEKNEAGGSFFCVVSIALTVALCAVALAALDQAGSLTSVGIHR